MGESGSGIEDFSEGYKQAHMLFVALLGLCAYMVLAALDQRVVDARLEQERKELVSEHAKAESEANSRARDERGAQAQLTRSLARFGQADADRAGSADLTPLIAAAQRRVDEAARARAASAAAQQRFALARSAFDLASAQLARAEALWNRNDSAAEQAALQQRFRAARVDQGRRRAEFEAAHKTVRDNPLESSTADSGAARDFLEANAAFVTARGLALAAAHQRDDLAARVKAVHDRIDSTRAERLKLPLVEVELDRTLFNMAGSSAVLLLFVFFGLYVMHLKHRMERTFVRMSQVPMAGASAYPWSLIVGNEASGSQRLGLSMAIFTSVPLALYVVWVGPALGVQAASWVPPIWSLPTLLSALGASWGVLLIVRFNVQRSQLIDGLRGSGAPAPGVRSRPPPPFSQRAPTYDGATHYISDFRAEDDDADGGKA